MDKRSLEAELTAGCWMYKPRSTKHTKSAMTQMITSIGGSTWNRRWVWTTPSTLCYGAKKSVKAENVIHFAEIKFVKPVSADVMKKEGCPEKFTGNGFLLRTTTKEVLWACETKEVRNAHVRFFAAVMDIEETGYDEEAVKETQELRRTLAKGHAAEEEEVGADASMAEGGDDSDDDDDYKFQYDDGAFVTNTSRVFKENSNSSLPSPRRPRGVSVGPASSGLENFIADFDMVNNPDAPSSMKTPRVAKKVPPPVLPPPVGEIRQQLEAYMVKHNMPPSKKGEGEGGEAKPQLPPNHRL